MASLDDTAKTHKTHRTEASDSEDACVDVETTGLPPNWEEKGKDDISSSSMEESDQEDDEDIDCPPLIKFFTQKMSLVLYIVLGGLLIAYTLWAFILDFERARPLLILEVIVFGYILVGYIAGRFFEDSLAKLQDDVVAAFASLEGQKLPAAVAIIAMMMTAALIVEEARNLISALGLVSFVFLSYLTSWKPAGVKWRPVLGGIMLQFILGILVLKTSAGYSVFEFFADQITTLLNYNYAGSSFVYGYLVDTKLAGKAFLLADGSEYYLFPPFYFNALSVIFFFSALISICHYLRIVEWLMKKLGYVLALVMGTSAAETLSASANIFLGQSDAPLMIKSFMPDMTDSELHAVMTAGFATVAGSVLAAYASFGIDATHLLGASVMSAPAALAISKVIYPETKQSKTGSGIQFDVTKSTDSNLIEAAATGASFAIQLVLSIGAQLIAFLALVAMLDGFLAGIGSLIEVDLSFASICSYLFYPFAWLMGIAPHDCRTVASLLGSKVFLNEFVAYTQLAQHMANGELDHKSVVIATYALCGFSNFGSIGIQLGTLTPLAPNKAKSLSKLVFSAMIAGNTACFMTACIAGLLYDSEVVEASISSPVSS